MDHPLTPFQEKEISMESNGPIPQAVNVQEIMNQIRQRIETKKQTGEYTPEELERISRYVLQIDTEEYNPPEEYIYKHLSQLNYLFDTLKPPDLSSHRQRLAGLVTGIKKIIRRITEPYIRMILKRQVDFNAETVRLLNQLVSDYRYRMSRVEQRLEQQETKRSQDLLSWEKRWESFTCQVDELTQEIRTQKNSVDDLLVQLRSAESRSGEDKIPLEKASARLRAFEYLRFENRHRGPEEQIRANQRLYLSYFRNTGKVLDIGCGRGEFLEILEEAGIPALGLELNSEMVALARQKGLNVLEEDGLEYLKTLPDLSLGGIFLSQVIEHLDPDILRDLVRTAFFKLAPGGTLLAETINPKCLTTFSGAFYLDLSHHNPIHPEATRFLWESLGFRQVEILFRSPYPQEMHLETMVRRHDETYEDEISRVLNKNVEQLNDLLYSDQDYAVIGYR
jgi:SAM-dependent methyltransferase